MADELLNGPSRVSNPNDKIIKTMQLKLSVSANSIRQLRNWQPFRWRIDWTNVILEERKTRRPASTGIFLAQLQNFWSTFASS